MKDDALLFEAGLDEDYFNNYVCLAITLINCGDK